MKKLTFVMIALVLCFSGCGKDVPRKEESSYKSRFEAESTITLSDDEISFDGEDVLVSNDIIYYEDRQTYDNGNPYGEGTQADMHTAKEAKAHKVINITKSGAYRITGKLSKGQIRIDLGEEAKEDPNAVVEIILDNADITCTVAPAILFMNVYECDVNRTADTAKSDVDTSKAGAVLVTSDGSVNNISGSYVAKIYKDNGKEKKLWKQDGAIYSYMSMNVFGGGTLNLNAENEGMDTELHLTINSGNINIISQNDGINTNEDGVSVTTINGGNINILAGLGNEGDGIDSNGWLVINGGTVVSSAKQISDSGLDSDMGSFINGGTVVALGSSMDWPESDSKQVAINLQFMQEQSVKDTLKVINENGDTVFTFKQTDESIAITDRGFTGAVISCPDFKVDAKYKLYSGKNQLGYYGSDMPFGGMHGKPPKMPEDGKRPPEFDGKRPPEFDGEPPKMPGSKPPIPFRENYEDMEQKTEFVMTDKVNLFTGVSRAK